MKIKILSIKALSLISLFSCFLAPYGVAKDIPSVAIAKIIAHGALDAVERGVVDGLKSRGYIEGETVSITFENAHGSIPTLAQIATKFTSIDPTVIIAISTPVAQAMANATKSSQTSIVFTAVTDAISAGLVKSMEVPGGHITGTIDFPPLADQLGLLMSVHGDVSSVGVLYNPGEANSIKQLQVMEELCAALNIKLVKAPVFRITEVLPAALRVIQQVDGIMIPQDNMVVSTLTSLSEIAIRNGKILVAPDPEGVKAGALLTIGFSHYQEGFLAGEKAADIIEGKSPAIIPVEMPEDKKPYVNMQTAEALNIQLPASLIEKAVKIVP
ncbi:MAG: ABC transporter substrate-binding protein [Alphaproteobacteria bacterium]